MTLHSVLAGKVHVIYGFRNRWLMEWLFLLLGFVAYIANVDSELDMAEYTFATNLNTQTHDYLALAFILKWLGHISTILFDAVL